MGATLLNFLSILDAIYSGVTALQREVDQVSLTQQRMVMTMAEDFTLLNAALSGLKDEVVAIGAEMDTLLADLKAALATGNQPAIDAATAAVQAQIDALKAAAMRDMPAGP
jgi:hypothetical protein